VIEGISRRWLNNAFPANMPLVLLHPNYSNQHLILDAAFNQPRRTAIFFALTRPQSSLETMWELLTSALQEQLGQQLTRLENIEKSAKSAVKALQTVGDFTLIIDAFDFADETVQEWVAALANNLPANAQIVISSRRLPMSLMTNPSVQGKIVVFPVDSERMLVDYIDQPSDTALLEVFGLGPGRAYINGKPIDRWDGMLPRSLFFYLIDRGMVTRDEIFQTFWPSLSVREATNVFHVTKRKISEILGFDLTVYWSGFYRVSPNVNLQYDVVKFIESVQNSVVAEDEEAIHMLEHAVYLYRGAFFSSLTMDWATSRRGELEMMYTDALSSLGKLRQRRGEMAEALGLFLRAARTQPHREDLARGIMSLYAELGQPERAVEIYNRLSTELKRKLGVDPDKKTIELAESIRRS
jgi:DNA-binding SARP family transcriptional activator